MQLLCHKMWPISAQLILYSYFKKLGTITIIIILNYQVFLMRILTVSDIICEIHDNFCQKWGMHGYVLRNKNKLNILYNIIIR